MYYTIFFSLDGERATAQTEKPSTVRHLISCINSETPDAEITVFHGTSDVTEDFMGKKKQPVYGPPLLDPRHWNEEFANRYADHVLEVLEP